MFAISKDGVLELRCYILTHPCPTNAVGSLGTARECVRTVAAIYRSHFFILTNSPGYVYNL